MFHKFLNSLKRPNNISLIEAIHHGYQNIFENIGPDEIKTFAEADLRPSNTLLEAEGNLTFKTGKEPLYGVFDQLTAIMDGKAIGRLVYEENHPKQDMLYIELIETDPAYRRQGIAEKMIAKMRELFPNLKPAGIPTNDASKALFEKLDIINTLYI